MSNTIAGKIPWNYARNRPTVGYQIQEHLDSQPDIYESREVMREFGRDHMQEVLACVDKHTKIIDGEFYVVVLARPHAYIPNFYRFSIGARKTRPKPHWKQTLYHYNPVSGDLTLQYALPSRKTADFLWEQRSSLPDEYKELMSWIGKHFKRVLK